MQSTRTITLIALIKIKYRKRCTFFALRVESMRSGRDCFSVKSSKLQPLWFIDKNTFWKLTSRPNRYFNTDLAIHRIGKGMFLVLWAGWSRLQKRSEFTPSNCHRVRFGLSRKPATNESRTSHHLGGQEQIFANKQINIKVNNYIVQLLLYSHLLFNARIWTS